MTITFTLAWENPGRMLSGRQVRIWFAGPSLGEIYFQDGDDGGFGYRGEGDGGGGGIICVPKGDFVEGAFYTFTLEVDAGEQAYNISVVGPKSDGSQLAFKAERVEFFTPTSTGAEVKGVYILAPRRATAYIGSLSIETK